MCNPLLEEEPSWTWSRLLAVAMAAMNVICAFAAEDIGIVVTVSALTIVGLALVCFPEVGERLSDEFGEQRTTLSDLPERFFAALGWLSILVASTRLLLHFL